MFEVIDFVNGDVFDTFDTEEEAKEEIKRMFWDDIGNCLLGEEEVELKYITDNPDSRMEMMLLVDGEEQWDDGKVFSLSDFFDDETVIAEAKKHNYGYDADREVFVYVDTKTPQPDIVLNDTDSKWLADKLYALNKLAKCYRQQGVLEEDEDAYGEVYHYVYRDESIDAIKETLYELKDLILEKCGTPTGVIHCFSGLRFGEFSYTAEYNISGYGSFHHKLGTLTHKRSN